MSRGGGRSDGIGKPQPAALDTFYHDDDDDDDADDRGLRAESRPMEEPSGAWPLLLSSPTRACAALSSVVPVETQEEAEPCGVNVVAKAYS
jgi:hypothetical protein